MNVIWLVTNDDTCENFAFSSRKKAIDYIYNKCVALHMVIDYDDNDIPTVPVETFYHMDDDDICEYFSSYFYLEELIVGN